MERIPCFNMRSFDSGQIALTLSRSCTVRASRFTRPIRSTKSARVTRIRLSAIGVGKDRSSSEKKLCVLNGGLM